jgi:ribosomal protein L32
MDKCKHEWEYSLPNRTCLKCGLREHQKKVYVWEEVGYVKEKSNE